MKTLELNLNKRLLIVGYENETDLNEDLHHYQELNQGLSPELKEIKIKVLCKGSDLTEEITKGFSKCLFDRFYIDYKHDDSKLSYAGEYQLNTALESFISAIEAQGYYWDVNPYQMQWDELCEWGHGDFSKDGKSSFDIYHEAESRTLNPEEIIIFEEL